MVEFPASVTGDSGVSREDLPMPKNEKGDNNRLHGQDLMHGGKTSTFVCVPLRDFELVIIISLNFYPKMMSTWLGSFSSSVAYLSWILMFGVCVMSLHDCLSLL